MCKLAMVGRVEPPKLDGGLTRACSNSNVNYHSDAPPHAICGTIVLGILLYMYGHYVHITSAVGGHLVNMHGS